MPRAVTAISGGSSTAAADSDMFGSPRQITTQVNAMSLLRVPTRVTSAVTSSTSPAFIGARNCTSE